MTSFDVFVGDMRTGRIFTHLSPSACTWQQAPLNDAGTMAATIQATDPDQAAKDLYHTTATARAFLAVAYGSSILNAGPIWTRTYDSGNGQLELGALGLWSLFDHRKIIPVLAEPVVTTATSAGAVQSASGDTTYPTGSNLSLADIAKRLVQQAMGHVGGNLPLVLPADQGLTPGATRTYNGFELKDLGPELKEITAAGTEIRLTPRFTDGTRTAIQWIWQASTPTSPLLVQTGADWVYDRSAPQSAAGDVKYAEDATNFGTRAWATGNGSQRSILMSQRDSTSLTSPPAGYPLLEIEQTFSGVGDQPTLDAHTTSLLASNNRPSAIWTLLMQQDGGLADGPPGAAVPSAPALGTPSVGDYAQILTHGDPFLPDTPPGGRRVRIQQVSGDLSYAYTISCFAAQAEL